MRNLKLKGELLTRDLLPTEGPMFSREAAAADFLNERFIRACNHPLQTMEKILHKTGEKKMDLAEGIHVFKISFQDKFSR